MTAEHDGPGFLDQPLGEYLETLGSHAPVPASGTTAALVAAAAAALVEKVARISTDWEGSRGAAAQARALRARLTALAPADAASYVAALGAVRAASGLPPDERDVAVGRAFAQAADVPLAIADAAADAAELAAETAARCKPAVRPDAVTAAELAEASVRVCAGLVDANLTSVPGDGRTSVAAALAGQAAAARERARAAP